MKILLAAAAAILCTSGMAYAQTMCTTFSLIGSVIIPARNYPEYIDVQLLTKMGEERIARTNLDSNNRFFMDQLPGGEFDLVVRVEGFKELREIVRLQQGLGVLVPSTGVCAIEEFYWLLPEDTLVVVDGKIRGYSKEAVSEYELAIEAERDKRTADVVAHLEKVVMLAADWLDAHCELGAAYEKLHRESDAESQYRTALQLKPDNFRALMSLSRLLVAEVDERIQNPATRDSVRPLLDQARGALSSAILSDPKSAMATYLLGTVDFRLEAYPEAETALNHALELDSQIYPARIMLINVYVEQKRWQDALESADTFIIENPLSPYRSEVIATRTGILRRLQTPK